MFSLVEYVTQAGNTAPPLIPLEPKIRIIEQPAKYFRFRYASEGNRLGSLPGSNSTPEYKTFPSIEIVGHEGEAVVVISCVTENGKDGMHKPHPYSLFGEGGCKQGVYALKVNIEGSNRKIEFKDIGIQCVKKQEVRAALETRNKINVNPFNSNNILLTVEYFFKFVCLQLLIQTKIK